MRRIFFIITIISLFALMLFMNLPPKAINSPDEFSFFQENQKILVEGNVIKETQGKNYKMLFLDNEFQLKCPLPCASFLGENISAIAILERYNDRDYLKVLKIIDSNR